MIPNNNATTPAARLSSFGIVTLSQRSSPGINSPQLPAPDTQNVPQCYTAKPTKQTSELKNKTKKTP